MNKQEVFQSKSKLSDTCWFCEKRPADQSDSIKVKMHRNAIKTKPAPKYTKVTWLKRTIDVPRCKECMSFDNKGIFIVFVGMVLSCPAAYLGYLFASSLLGWTDEGLHILGGAIGFFMNKKLLVLLFIFFFILSLGIVAQEEKESEEIPEEYKVIIKGRLL